MENFGLYLFFTREVSSYLVHEIETSFVFFLAFLQDLQNKGFLEVINKYLEVHATVGGGVSKNLNFFPFRLICDTLSAG